MSLLEILQNPIWISRDPISVPTPSFRNSGLKYHRNLGPGLTHWGTHSKGGELSLWSSFFSPQTGWRGCWKTEHKITSSWKLFHFFLYPDKPLFLFLHSFIFHCLAFQTVLSLWALCRLPGAPVSTGGLSILFPTGLASCLKCSCCLTCFVIHLFNRVSVFWFDHTETQMRRLPLCW